MIITFCGHSDFMVNEKFEAALMQHLEDRAGDDAVFYLGGYGGFDDFALACAKKYKAKHPKAELFFITPYLHTAQADSAIDGTIYPEIENKLPRFAIVYRNRWMIDRADLVIAYVDRCWGGAYQTYRYALSRGKEILNLAALH